MAIISGTPDDDVLAGDGENDRIDGLGGNDVLLGNGGDDALYGGDGNDELYGGGGSNTLNGGGGNDAVTVTRTFSDPASIDTVDGGSGADTLIVDFAGSDIPLTFSLNGTSGDGSIISSNFETLIYTGGSGGDSVTGAAGADQLFGYAGNDVLRGGAGADQLDGGAGTDLASYFTSSTGVTVNLATGTGSGGEAQGDTLVSIENLSGSQGNDTLTGNGAANTLQGWNGSDALRGAGGKDTLTGGAGADRFAYGSIGESVVGANADRITDFSHTQGDRIDLSAIDADWGVAGNQAFTFIGTSLYTHQAGELRYAFNGADTTIAGDVNGDGVTDFHIALTGHVALVAADFVL